MRSTPEPDRPNAPAGAPAALLGPRAVTLLRRALLELTGRLSTTEAVRASFRALLGREPELVTCEAASQALRRDPAGLEHLLEQTLLSPESAQRNTQRMLASQSGLRPDLDIISLGSHCYTSQFLKVWGLKRWSGPFDWVFSSLPMVAHCLQDDFTAFLDRSQYEPVPLDQRLAPEISRCEHRLYRTQFGVRHVFNHHDAQLDADHGYFVRCVERLRIRLASPANKTFFATVHDRPDGDAAIATLHTALSERTHHFRLVVIRVSAAVAPWSHAQLLQQEDSLHVWRLTPGSAWQPLQFADLADDLCVARLLAHSALR